MKKYLLSTLIMIAGLFTLAVNVRAETAGVLMNIDREFVAGGKVFPAGTYKVYQSSPEAGQALLLRSQESGTSVFLLPNTHDSNYAGPLEMRLTREGDVYYLSEIVTDLGVYTFSAPQTQTRSAKAKDPGRTSTSGSH